MLWQHRHCALRDIRTRLAYLQFNTGQFLRPFAQLATGKGPHPSGWARFGARRDANRHRLPQWCPQRPLWFRLAMAAPDGPSTATQTAQYSGYGIRTTPTTSWFKAGPAVIAADRMHSRIAPPLRFGSPLSPATPGPRAARFGRDGARGCRFVELPLIACGKKGWGWLSLSAWASRLAARQAIGDGRREPVGGCGTPAEEPALSTPLRGGQRSRPRAGAGTTARHGNRRGTNRSPTLWRTPHALTPTALAHHPLPPRACRVHRTENQCRSLVRRSCRTRGGWLTLGVNSDMRRHGELAPKGSQPHTPQGSGCAASPGVVLSRFRTIQRSIQWTANEPSDIQPDRDHSDGEGQKIRTQVAAIYLA